MSSKDTRVAPLPRRFPPTGYTSPQPARHSRVRIRETLGMSSATPGGIVHASREQRARAISLTVSSLLLTWCASCSYGATLLATRLRSALDPFQSYTAVGLEARHTLRLGEGLGLQLAAAAERQWTATLPAWSVPAVGVSAWWSGKTFALRGDLAALGLERWEDRGALGDATLWALATFGASSPVREVAVQDTKSLALTIGAGAFVRFARWKTDFDGRPLTGHGLRERVELEGRWGRLGGALAVTFEQRIHEREPVRTGYAIRERARFFFSNAIAAGLEHESLGNLYDEVTGQAAPLQLADLRTSRVGAFVEARW